MISNGPIYYFKKFAILHLLSLLNSWENIFMVILKYFLFVFFISSNMLNLYLNILLQLFFYNQNLINWCYLIFSFCFSCFPSFLFWHNFSFQQVWIFLLCIFSISFCILNFYLDCLKLFCLRVMVTGLSVTVTYIISFRIVRLGLKSWRRSSMA